MPQPIAGPGVPLPAPQFLYPRFLFGDATQPGAFTQALTAGDVLVVPAGNWLGSWPSTCQLQWYDGNVTGQWINANAVFPIGVGSDAAGVGAGAPAVGSAVYFKSDGVNVRIANLTNVAWAANVSAAGSGYSAATTTVTPSAGNSTWLAVVGGSLGTPTLGVGGAGYTMPPLVFVPDPPFPGVPATITA